MSNLLAVPVKDVNGNYIALGAGTHTLSIPVGRLELNAGRYSFMVYLRDASDHTGLCRHQGLLPFNVQAERVFWSRFVREGVSLQLPG